MKKLNKMFSLMLAAALCLGEICTAQAAAAGNSPESIEASADPAESAGTAENQDGMPEEENQFYAEKNQKPEEGQSLKGGAAGEAEAAPEPGESQPQEGDAKEAEAVHEPGESRSQEGGAAEAAEGTPEPAEKQSQKGGAAELAESNGRELFKGAEGTPEPAENFVPENMILVSGADARLLPVQELAYDAASGMLTWQPSELADEYQIEVTDPATGQSAASLTAKLGQASLEQVESVTDRTYSIQVTARSERRIYLVGVSEGADSDLAAKSDGFYMDDDRTFYYYYHFAESAPVIMQAVLTPVTARTVTSVNGIAFLRQANGYYEFQVLSPKLQDTEYLRVEYSNNKSFKNSGKKFTHEAKRTGDVILKSLRAGDGHTTKGYHRYQGTEQIYRSYLGYFSPGETVYVRARIYNSGYRLEESEHAEDRFSGYQTLACRIPDLEMGVVNTVVTEDSITLCPSLEEGWATGFEFQKKVNGSWVKLAKQTGNASYQDSGLEPGVSYSYRVRGYAYNRLSKKTVYTKWQKANANTFGSALRLKAEAKGTDAVKLSWNAVKGVDGYRIYRSDTVSSGYTRTEGGYIDNFANYTLAATIEKPSQTSYTDKKLTAGKEYFYVVCAYWEKDGQENCLQESASVLLSSNAQMTFTSSSYTQSGKFTVAWNKMAGIKGYKVQVKNAAGNYKNYKTLKASATKITLPKVKAGKAPVTYRIYPYTKKKQLTAKGAEFTVEPTLGIVKNVKAKADAGGITVSWRSVSGADYYEVYRCSGNDYTYDADSKTYRVDLEKAVLVESVKLVTEGALQAKPEDVNVAQDGTLSYDYVNEDVYGYAADASGQIVPALYDPDRTVIRSKITKTKVRDAKVTVKGLVPKTEEQLALSKDTGVFCQYAKDTAGVLETAEATLKEGPAKGTTYYYVVRAVAQGKGNAGNACSVGFSRPASAVCTSAGVKAVTKVKARNTLEECAVLSFTAAKNADGYMIYRSDKKNSGYRLIATTSKTIFRDKTTSPGKTYYYKIVSYCTNESGARVYSAKTKPVKITIKKEDISMLDLMLEQ